MKKILFFILSLLSIITYANDENIENQIGEKLEIDVKFTLPKEIIKYVVYAEKNGVIEDTLNLPNFFMSQDSSKAGFVETPPKVYVKRIIDGKISELSDTERVTYVLNHVDGFMDSTTVPNDEINPLGTSYRQITSYLTRTTLEDIIKNSGIVGYSVNTRGSIIKNNSGTPPKIYFPAAQINMYNNNGVLETTSPKNIYSYPIPIEDIQKIETYIGNGKPLGNVSLKVIVK